MKSRICTAILAAMTIPLSAYAAIRNYQADIDESQWELSRNSKLECELRHVIPHYGEAVFRSHSGKIDNLVFTMQMRQQPARKGAAVLKAVPPDWKPSEQALGIAEMPLYRQFDGELGEQQAWTMLTELERGWQPTFFYEDWFNHNQQVRVGLSAINFKPQYTQFVSCIAGLLPYSFDDIAFTVLVYEKNSDMLSKESRSRLDMIAEYLKYDPELQMVLVDAYTDSYGGRWHNEQLSIRRAKAVEATLVEQGIDKTRIVSEGHGEKRHIDDNASPLGREKNRRVVVRLSRD